MEWFSDGISTMPSEGFNGFRRKGGFPLQHLPKLSCAAPPPSAFLRFRRKPLPEPNARKYSALVQYSLQGSLLPYPKVCGRRQAVRDTSKAGHCRADPEAKHRPNQWLSADLVRPKSAHSRQMLPKVRGGGFADNAV